LGKNQISQANRFIGDLLKKLSTNNQMTSQTGDSLIIQPNFILLKWK